jgi:4a-hydroxytetrahydrobiopterin dehydratase
VDQLPQYLAALPAWQLSEDHRSISRSFVAKNFVAAVDFFNAVKEVAEAEGHHPDLHLANYREVQVRL